MRTILTSTDLNCKLISVVQVRSDGTDRLFLKYGVFIHAKILGGRPKKTTHPPHPPNTAPPGTKRVPFCSFLNSASICILTKICN